MKLSLAGLMQMMRGPVALFLAAVLSWGCGQGGRGPVTAEVSDSEGVRIVVNRGGGNRVSAGVREAVRIGAGEGDGSVAFVEVAAVAAEQGDTLFVADGRRGSIRVFSPGGRFIREFGSRGQGPGEFLSFTSLFLAGDTVAVVGAGPVQKAVLYSRTGEVLGSWNLIRSDGLTLVPLAFLRTGWIGIVNDPRTWPQQWAPGSEVPVRRDVRAIDLAGDSLGPIFLPLPPIILRTDSAGRPRTGLFRVLPETGVDGNGRIYSVLENRYRVDVFDQAGRHIMAVLREHQPVPLRDRDVGEVLEIDAARWDTASELHGLDRATLRRLGAASIRAEAAAMPFDTLSPVRRLLVARAGGFWIERIDHLPPVTIVQERQVALQGPGGMARLDRPTRWDVFGDDGRLRHTVELPPRFAPLLVTDSSATGLARDGNGAEYVATYVIDTGG